MGRTSSLAVVLAVVAVSSAIAWTWDPAPPPMFLRFVRPRRAPPMPVPVGRPPPGQPGMPIYPGRALSFSGYFSGAGVPQPDTLTWGPAFRNLQEERSAVDGAPTTAESPLEESGVGGVQNVSLDAEAQIPDDTASNPEESDNVDARAKQDPPRKQPRPSYPAPPSGPPRGPEPAPSPAPGPSSGGYPGDAGDNDNDPRGYGTINAWFPFMFSGGWPAGPSAGSGSPSRGYGASNNSPSYGAPSSGGLGSYGTTPAPAQGNRPQEVPGGSQTAASPSGGGAPYYPVAIANSFSTGRNAVASSTATAYGGAPPNRSSS